MNIEYLDILAGRFTPAQYFRIVEKSRCSQTDRQLLQLAYGSFEEAYTHYRTELLAIDSIKEAARHPRKVVWETGIIMLAQLAQTNESAQTELTKMALDANSGIRARSLFYLTDQHDRKYCLDLLKCGIGDRSASVSHVAAWKAVKLERTFDILLFYLSHWTGPMWSTPITQCHDGHKSDCPQSFLNQLGSGARASRQHSLPIFGRTSAYRKMATLKSNPDVALRAVIGGDWRTIKGIVDAHSAQVPT